MCSKDPQHSSLVSSLSLPALQFAVQVLFTMSSVSPSSSSTNKCRDLLIPASCRDVLVPSSNLLPVLTLANIGHNFTATFLTEGHIRNSNKVLYALVRAAETVHGTRNLPPITALGEFKSAEDYLDVDDLAEKMWSRQSRTFRERYRSVSSYRYLDRQCRIVKEIVRDFVDGDSEILGGKDFDTWFSAAVSTFDMKMITEEEDAFISDSE